MEEAQKYVWEGAIPLQIHLHESEVTTLPTPPPALILAPRIGYLPLLVPQIKPHFSNALPPGSPDTVWFDYNGLPLKWYIPTGVLFDLLCAEPERPWNLTVHFRGYPSNILVPCEGEDSVKWSFINSLKEAAYIINGNCKNVMNMSQPDQVELWRSVLNVIHRSYILSCQVQMMLLGVHKMLAAIDKLVPGASATHPEINKEIWKPTYGYHLNLSSEQLEMNTQMVVDKDKSRQVEFQFDCMFGVSVRILMI
ncbi:hypothetical protein ACB092_11G056100 [Castanea dentata]